MKEALETRLKELVTSQSSVNHGSWAFKRSISDQVSELSRMEGTFFCSFVVS
jgi:hypothetical protein